MNTTRRIVAALSLLLVGTPAMGQIAAPKSSGQMVNITVVIAEFAAAGRTDAAVDLRSAEDAGARLRELEEQGAITMLTRVMLTSLDGRMASVQIGERISVPTGRTMGGRRGGADGNPFPVQTSYTAETVGTMVTGRPQVQADGSVVVEFRAEKSRLVAAPAGEPAAADASPADFQPSRLVTLSSESTVSIPSGGTVIIGGLESSSEGGSNQSVILLTASVEGEPAGEARASSDAKSVKVVHLRYARAKDLAAAIATVLDNSELHIGVDERTNSLLVRAAPEVLDTAEALLKVLDESE